MKPYNAAQTALIRANMQRHIVRRKRRNAITTILGAFIALLAHAAITSDGNQSAKIIAAEAGQYSIYR